MSTVSANPTPAPSSEAGEVSALGEMLKTRNPAAWISLGLLIAVVVWFGWETIWRQLGMFSWTRKEDWGHSYIVPLVSVYFIWMHRKLFQAVPMRRFWPGTMLVVLGVMTYFYFHTMFSNHMFAGGALILIVAGLTLTLFGPRAFALAFFPIAFLGLGVTVAEAVMIQITFKLQNIAAIGANIMLNTVGVETRLQGNVLYPVNPFTNEDMEPLNVAQACSGMRMVIAFVALSVAVAFLSCREWWQRIAVVMLGVPVAIFMNVVRVAVLGIVSIWKPELAQGDAHMLIGMVLLVPAFFLFMGCVWVLKNMVREPAEAVS
ncbi:MAG: exosortase/archaeosortase family protein [Planctomycetota bacterium]